MPTPTLRKLRGNPGLTAAAVLCLAVGIGATTTMAEVVDVLLLRPPAHVRDARQVVELDFDFVFPGARGRQPANMVAQGVAYAPDTRPWRMGRRPALLGAAVAVVLAVTTAALAVPGLRAARADPAAAMREK